MNYSRLLLFSTILLLCTSCQKPQTNNYVLPESKHTVTPGKQGQKEEQGGQQQEPQKEKEKPVLTTDIYSISCGPGEDASNGATISWAVDASYNVDTYVLYTTVSDSEWDKALKAEPEQNYSCNVFDGVRSDDPNGKEILESAKFTKCGATLSGLKSDTDYKYVIRTSDGKQSREGKFRTAGAKSWSCCIISDFHSYTPLPKRLTAAMGMIDRIKAYDSSLDWILSPGDVVAWGGSYSFWKRFFEEDNVANYMWARANGNHDNWTKESQETGDYNIPNDYFKGTSYYPQNGYGEEMGVCYHFRYQNTLFVVLNTEDMASGNELKAARDWAKEVITKAKTGPDAPTFTVVMMHYEWFYGTNGKTSEYGNWHTLFDQLGVDLAVAGNNHVYLRSHPILDGKVSTTAGRGTVYLQTPASDNDRGREIDPSDFRNSDLIAFRWTEGSHSVGAVHMAVEGKKMVLQLFDRNGKVQDSTVINAR